MKISLKTWMAYTAQLRAVNNKAAEELISWVRDQGGYDGLDREALIRRAHALATKYGETAAAAACDIYDATAAAQGVRVPPAEPAPTATFGETAKAVVGTLKQSPLKVPSTVGRLVKQAGADTVLHNAARDGAEFAWIPSGDTCPFCLMLASNGWQRQSEKKAKAHAGHIHANCDCQYAVRFDGKSSVEGYEPEKYREIYESAEGDTPEEKLRSMQRQQRAENRDEINARKRERYAERQRNNNSTDTTNVDLKHITSEAYRMKFRGISGKDKVDDSIFHNASKILKHRAGTEYEDLVLLDADKGTVIHTLDTSTNKNGVVYDDATNEAIKRAHKGGRRIVAIHNHPNSLPPTLDDGVSMLTHGYDIGIVVGHDGTIYQFTAATEIYSKMNCDEVHNNISYQIKTGGQIEEVWYNILEQYGVHIVKR